ALSLRHVLAQEYADRIGLLARRAAGYPDPDRILGPLALEQLGYDGLLQRLERLRIPEEGLDADQQVLELGIELLRILAQPLDEVRLLVDLQHLHAPLHAPRDGLVLVAAEIMPGAGAQQRRDLGQMVGRFRPDPVRPLAPVDIREMPEVLAE